MNVTPIAILGQYEKDNNLYPAARILNDDQNIAFNAAFVAGSFVSLFEAFLSHVPENKKIEFEQNFKNALTAMLNNKEQYKIKFHDHNN
jgi:hypothetical protein